MQTLNAEKACNKGQKALGGEGWIECTACCGIARNLTSDGR